MITKVTNTDGLPKMTSIGYIGQTAEQLSQELRYRREMLTYTKPEPRLKCVGEDRYGLIYIDLDDWIER